jgi:sporulation protein YlmC with PRC-barrel domain
MIHQQTTNSEIEKLSDTGLELEDPGQDIRNRKVVDVRNEDVGHVSALFIDRAERKVRMLEIREGGFLGFGTRHFLLPVDAITSIDAGEVHIDQTRERVVDSPAYDPTLIETPTRDYWEPFYGYYGLSPFWGSGYMYPQFPISSEERHRNESSGYQGD